MNANPEDMHNPQHFSSGIGLKALAVIGMIFGAMTLFSAGNVLFGPSVAKEMAGNIVPFVVWFNFAAGFLYIAAGLGVWAGRGWATTLAALIAIGTGLVALAFAWSVFNGQEFEMRTVGALILRAGLWTVVALVTWRVWR